MAQRLVTFGVGLPLLYFAFAGVVLNSLTSTEAIFVSALSFFLIALGRKVRVRGAQPNNESAHAARLVGNNAPGHSIDDDPHPSNLGSTERFETRKIGYARPSLSLSG